MSTIPKIKGTIDTRVITLQIVSYKSPTNNNSEHFVQAFLASAVRAEVIVRFDGQQLELSKNIVSDCFEGEAFSIRTLKIYL